jgi:hypothetical protein
MKRFFTIVYCCLLLMGCQPGTDSIPTPVSEPLPESAWSQIERVAQAEQSAAPALLTTGAQLVLAWNSADDSEARHFVRGNDGIGRIVAIKAWHPFYQTLLPAASRELLLLWLDRTQTVEELRLQAGIISENAVAVLGPNVVSGLPTRSYSALPVETGAFVVWSARLGAVTNLYADIIDRQARPSETIELRRDADYPVLVQDDGGTIHLYWLENYGRQVMHATIGNPDQPRISEARAMIQTNRIAVSDAIESFSVALDSNHAHLFWNLRKLDGTRSVLHSAGDLQTLQYDAVQPLGITLDNSTMIQTTYRGGDAVGATRSSDPALAWATPLAGQHAMLPVAIHDGETLAIAWMRAGEVVGYQAVVQTGTLIGAPTIASDNGRNLYVSWSVPANDGTAQLYVTDTR